MEHQKIINLSDNTPNQPTKFRKNVWVEKMMIYVKRIKSKRSMLKSSLCDSNDAYILVSGTIPNDEAGLDDATKDQIREKTE